jgi:hypothetical protein
MKEKKRQTGSNSGFQFLVLKKFLPILSDGITASYGVFCVRHSYGVTKSESWERGEVRPQRETRTVE